MSESEVLTYAKKQRHAKLLEKIRSSKGLTTSELQELEEFEEMANKPKLPPKKGQRNADCLTEQMEAFCREFIKDWNASAAGRRAGYSKKTAGQQGNYLLKLPKIQARIKELKEKVVKKSELSLQMVLDELKKLALSNVGDYVKFGPDGVELNSSIGMTRDELACIAEVSESMRTKKRHAVRFKLHDKAKALVALLDYFNDNPGDDDVKKTIKLPISIPAKKN